MSSLLQPYLQNLPTSPSALQEFLEEMRSLFKNESSLIKIPKNPCIFIGDTHGDLESSKKIAEKFLREKDFILVFLGDYVDRGQSQLENVLFLFLLKRDYPKQIILLRGNHEEEEMNVSYGFRDVLTDRYRSRSTDIFQQFQQVFANLPLTVLTWNRILGVHGGIPISLKQDSISLREIEQRPRGFTRWDQFDFITTQLLWNDPKEMQGFTPSPRGIGLFFGQDRFEAFMNLNDLKFLIRSHEVFQEGYKVFFNGKLISIFSAMNYVYLRGISAKMVKIDTDERVEVLNIATE